MGSTPENMIDNTTSDHSFTNPNFAEFSDEQLVMYCQALNDKAKPIHNQMVDISLIMGKTVREIYARKFAVMFPDLPIIEEKSVLAITCEIEPRVGVAEIGRRVAAIKKEGIQIKRITFDQNRDQFTLWTTP